MDFSDPVDTNTAAQLMTPGEILQHVQTWLSVDRDDETRSELVGLVKSKNADELRKRFSSRITFGTAGLRGPMGAGYAYMNSVTVIQASQGLAAYVLTAVPEAKKKGIVIGHDARHNSEKFARLAAAAFISSDIRVHWFDKFVHTPLVPFTVAWRSAAAGVMITASHNPPRDNGYKVYLDNSCQIIPPHDAGISAAIDLNLAPRVWELDINSNNFRTIGNVNEMIYFEKVGTLVAPDLKIEPFMYTPLHGVGLRYLMSVLKFLPGAGPIGGSAHVKAMSVVPEQAQPDPTFPTVRFPNPEEKGALDLAIKRATGEGVDLIIANDPDADRLAVVQYVIKESEFTNDTEEEWYRFTGNEIGILLASYALQLYRADSTDTSKEQLPLCMLASTVSSSMLKAMAEAEGFRFVETLTGFKWLGNVAQQLKSEGYRVPFAFEEALGYMFTDVVWDKDGVAAATAFLAARAGWKKEGLTVYEKLQQLYQTYGYFAEANTYLITPSPEVTNQIFADIRVQGGDAPHPMFVDNEIITRWRDLTVGYDSATEDHTPDLPIDASSQMITCELSNNVRFTVRGSGTEPKVKLYVEGRGSTMDEARTETLKVQRSIIAEWFSPERYGLRLPD